MAAAFVTAIVLVRCAPAPMECVNLFVTFTTQKTASSSAGEYRSRPERSGSNTEHQVAGDERDVRSRGAAVTRFVDIKWAGMVNGLRITFHESVCARRWSGDQKLLETLGVGRTASDIQCVQGVADQRLCRLGTEHRETCPLSRYLVIQDVSILRGGIVRAL